MRDKHGEECVNRTRSEKVRGRPVRNIISNGVKPWCGVHKFRQPKPPPFCLAARGGFKKRQAAVPALVDNHTTVVYTIVILRRRIFLAVFVTL